MPPIEGTNIMAQLGVTLHRDGCLCEAANIRPAAKEVAKVCFLIAPRRDFPNQLRSGRD